MLADHQATVPGINLPIHMSYGIARLVGFVFGKLGIGAEIQRPMLAAEKTLHNRLGKEQQILETFQLDRIENVTDELGQRGRRSMASQSRRVRNGRRAFGFAEGIAQ